MPMQAPFEGLASAWLPALTSCEAEKMSSNEALSPVYLSMPFSDAGLR